MTAFPAKPFANRVYSRDGVEAGRDIAQAISELCAPAKLRHRIIGIITRVVGEKGRGG
jgi:hypothetical protein